MGWLELATELEAAHQNFVHVALQLDIRIHEKGGVCGEWSPKDVVAHLVGWDAEAAYSLGLFANGEGDTYDYTFDVDEFNDRSVNTRKALSWNRLMNDLSLAHHSLQEEIKALHAKKLNSDGGFAQWLVGRKTDYKIHTEQLELWLSTEND
jgi:hypothetical protein